MGALRRLRQSRQVVVAPAWDSLGREYDGLYLAESEPVTERSILFRPGELRGLRQAAGLSARALGEMVGVAGNTVSRWETGVRTLPPVKAKALRGVLADLAR